MKKSQFVLAVLLAAVLAFALGRFVPEKEAASVRGKAYDRVMRTQTIRCVYAVGKPWLYVNPNTGERLGIMVEVMEEVGKALSMKIDWSAGEVGWGELSAAVESGRGDVICSAMWASANRARATAFTRPLFYTPINVWARADNRRFDNAPEKINASDVRVVVDDGDFNEVLAKTDFPKAQRITRPPISGNDYYFLTLLDGKADALFISDNYAQDFLKERPGTIRKVPLPKPLRVYENVIGTAIREQALRNMIDAAVGDLLSSGTITRILKKYAVEYPDTYFVTAAPYAPLSE